MSVQKITFFFFVCILLTTVHALSPRNNGGANIVLAGTFTPRAYLPLLNTPPGDILFGPVHTGEGTYYWEADGSGNCGFPATPDNLMVAALNNSDYGNADLCGAYIFARGPQRDVMVRIVDRCPECPPGDIDFSPQAFAQIADLPQGRVPISWQLVSAGISGPIAYYFEPNSNPWWTAVQIRNHRNPIVKLEYFNGSQWVEMQRMVWNYFIKQEGMDTGPFTFRITDYFGHTLIDAPIPLLPGSSVNGTAQFPPPP